MNISSWIECAGVPVPVFEPSLDDIYFEQEEELEEIEEIDFVSASFEEVF